MLGMDSPNARMIQTSAGVHPPLGWGWYQPSPGDDLHGVNTMQGWWATFVPRGYGLGFASGDTNPTLFGTTLTSLAVDPGIYPFMMSCVRQEKTNQGPVVRLDCGEGQTEVAMDKSAVKFRGAHSSFRHVGP